MVTIGSARPPRHPEDAAKGRGSVSSDMGKSFTTSMAALNSTYGRDFRLPQGECVRDFTKYLDREQ